MYVIEKLTKKFTMRIKTILLVCVSLLMAMGYSVNISAQNWQLKKYYQGNTSVNLDKRGYAIITTRDIALGLDELQAFAENKSALGFNVHIVTEEDFGGGRGEDAAFNIRRWLQSNYKKLDLLYVLLIGDPTPNCGDIPMKVVSMGTKDDLGEVIPTDYYYADISGNWDINNNGIVGERSDFKEGGLDGVWDVLVGRLLYYGENSVWGKLDDVDVLLRRFIDYDNEEDIDWRYNVFVYRPNQEIFASWISKYLEPNGINYVLMSETPNWAGLSRPDYIAGDGHTRYDILNENDFGHIKLQAHGTPTATWGINSDGVSKKLNPTKPGIVQFAGCFTGAPEKSNNIGGAMLRFYAIATEPNSMGVTSFTAPGPKVGIKPVMNNRKLKLLQGNSVGYAHWEDYADISRYASNTVGNTMLKHNLYGDPSIVVFKTGINVPSSVVVTPVKRAYFQMNSGNYADIAQKYTVWSNIDGEQFSSVEIDVDWLSYSIIGSNVDRNNGTDVEVKPNEKAANLGIGEHKATVLFKGSDGKITKRNFYICVSVDKQIAYYSFDGKGNDFLNEKLNTAAQYKVVPVKKGDMTTADINSIIKSAKTEGKLGKGLSCARDLSKFGYECNYLPFNNTGSSTHCFWIKHDANANGEILNFAKGVLSLKIDNEKYVLCIKENDHLAWEKNTPYILNKSIESASTVSDEWIYFSVVVDRDNNELRFYQNADEKGKVSLMEHSSLFADKPLVIAPFGGVIDELACYNFALSPDGLMNEMLGKKIVPVSPVNHGSTMNNKNVPFEWSALDDAVSYNFYITERQEDLLEETPLIRVRNFTDNKFVKQNLKQETIYYWRVDAILADGKIIKGMIFDFTVPKILWNLKELAVGETDVFVFDVIDELEDCNVCFYSGYSATLRKSPATIELFTTTTDGSETIIASRRFNTGKARNYIAETFEIDTQYLGSKVQVRIKGEKGTYKLNNAALYVDYDADEGQSADFTKGEISLENINVGDMSLNYDLSGDVDDVSNIKEFTLVYAPSWMQVQGNMLVSFRAPKVDDIGTHIFTIILVDKSGEKHQIKATISVTQQ
ncbi:hypothetical protein EYV94_09565 [Puteibacter caeruleilacunae]|nr:hypothetical protein EYV94_09565 [Puteibacter caeruleilacunae]